LKYSYKSGSKWYNETVDTGNVGRYSSITLDSAGNPFISYVDSTNHNLKLAFRYSGSWYKEVIGTGGGSTTSIALDKNNTPHISYSDGFKLLYAVKIGSVWSIQTVDSAGTYIGEYNSLALDSSGNPHISYYNETNGGLTGYDLKYAYYSGGAWHKSTVDSTGDVGGFNSIALDSSNNPHISYYDATNKKLKYASYTGSYWITQTADSGNVGEYTSLKLDSSNNPHITYYDGTNCDLKYAYKNGTSWKVNTVDNTWTVGSYNSLSLDSTGNPSISYAGGGYADVRYAYFSPLNLPKVSSIDPANKAVNVSPAKNIKVTFNQNIKSGNLNIVLKSSSGKVVPITTSISGKILTINHTSKLTNGSYILSLHTGCVTDVDGNALALYSSKFTVDSIPPTVKTIVPAKNSVNISRTNAITITFSEPVNVVKSKIQLKSSTGTSITISTSLSGKTLTITHSKLAKGTKYTLALNSGSITDKAGNKLSAYTDKFTTGNT
jgi:methionine-rich copper-binding protein CopC